MTVIFILIFCGLLTNILSAIFGVGGGIIIVPVLRQLFPDAPVQSIAATSLMVVMLGSLVNILLFRRYKADVNLKKMVIWCIAMIFGVQVGVYLSFLLPDKIIMLGFSATLILLALRTLLVKPQHKDITHSSDTVLGSFLCTLGGAIAGITGLGGGSVLAPLISQLPSVRTSQIAVYTNWMMFIGGLGSMWSYLTLVMPAPEHAMAKWQFGYVNFYVVAIIFCSSLAMSCFSMHLRGILSVSLSKKLFSALLVSISIFIFSTI